MDHRGLDKSLHQIESTLSSKQTWRSNSEIPVNISKILLFSQAVVGDEYFEKGGQKEGQY